MPRQLPAAEPDQADAVRGLFDATVDHWDGVYDAGTPEGVVYQRRQQAALDMVRQARGAAGPGRALDVGCGTGAMAAALAAEGWSVDAVDVSQEMVDRARLRADRAGLAGRVSVSTGDVHHLPEEAEGRYDLSVALGVVPWLQDPESALRELARVTKPGGWLVLTADNQLRVTHLLDPAHNPFLRPLRRLVGQVLLRTVHRRAMRLPSPAPPPGERRHRRGRVDRMLRAATFEPVYRRTIGFWPFTFFDRHLVGEARAASLNDRLQAWADRGIPVARAAGNHYVVVANLRSADGAGRSRGWPKASEWRPRR